ncbi:metal transporter CNNM4-like [Babylonia areolata]|uniref:metal transporter CNNM4-like n=1 Tax=Babylonia areolata TaxID=304850 RepID=UPI003FD34B4A
MACSTFSAVFFIVYMGFSVTATAGANTNYTQVFALLPREVSVDRTKEGILKLLPNVHQNLQLIGINFGDDMEIAFTPSPEEGTRDCDSSKRTSAFKPKAVNSKRTGAVFEVTLDKLDPGEEKYYLCVKQSTTWELQGSEPWQQITIKEVTEGSGTLLPLPVQIVIVFFLLFLSGLFSGLNLGLMALDKTELQIIEKCGSKTEKKYAKTITPLRKRGNFLLCTLLLGNVMVNSTATILLDDLSNGIVAVIVSTICIVVFGEIIPQAVCSRHGLAVGARTAYITRFFMIVTFPLSFPISLLLDKILGEEIGQVYDKEKLQELIRMTADHKVLQNDEANIIAGALQLASKRVEDVMTKIEDVYMLDVNTVLDFEMMSKILKSGYTRVPVYDGDKTNIVHLLNTKELALIDPDNNTPLKTVCRFYDHQPLFVDYDMRLDAMLQDFLQGKSHMAIVQCLQNEGDHDPFFENIGVVTLEDVIEEIIQSEIIDETDILTDNRKKKPRERQHQLEYDVFDQKHEHGPRISQQVAFAAYQFLSTAVEPFKEQYITRSVLKQLIRKKIFITMTPSNDDMDKNFIYKRGRDCDYFILLLEGHVEVEIGKENLMFESGPFTYFGVKSLDCLRDIKMESLKDSQDLRHLPLYSPDFSVRAITAVQFLRIRRVHYLAARRTSCMMGSNPGEDGSQEEAFHKEWHRTQADAMSRNTSVGGMCDIGEPSLSPLEIVQKRALASESSLKDRVVMANAAQASKDSPEEKGVQDTSESQASSGSLKTHSSKGSLLSSTSLPGDGKARTQAPSRENVTEVLISPPPPQEKDSGAMGEGGKPSGDGNNPSAAGYLCDGDAKGVGVGSGRKEVDLSPEEGGGGVGDRVPLVSIKEKDQRTTLTGQNGLAEEEDESCPLVSKQQEGGATTNLC